MGDQMKYKVLVVEDHEFVAYAYKLIISESDEFKVCAIVSTIEQVDDAIEKHAPDLILMDLYLPESENAPVTYDPINQKGLSKGLRLKKERPDIGVLFTSALVSEPTVRIILDSQHKGGLGFIQKGAPPNELVFTLKQVALGKKYVDFKTNKALLVPELTQAQRLKDLLTAKELEALVAIGRGLSRQQVAKQLNVKVGVIDNLLTNIRTKLREDKVSIGGSGEYSYVHLAHLAIAMNLIDVLTIEIIKGK